MLTAVSIHISQIEASEWWRAKNITLTLQWDTFIVSFKLSTGSSWDDTPHVDTAQKQRWQPVSTGSIQKHSNSECFPKSLSSLTFHWVSSLTVCLYKLINRSLSLQLCLTYGHVSPWMLGGGGSTPEIWLVSGSSYELCSCMSFTCRSHCSVKGTYTCICLLWDQLQHHSHISESDLTGWVDPQTNRCLLTVKNWNLSNSCLT